MRRHHSAVKKVAAAALLLPLPVLGTEPLALDFGPTSRTRPAANFVSSSSVDCRWPGCESRSRVLGWDFGAPRGFGAAFVEFRPQAAPGQTSRPKYGIGMRAPALETALDAVGLEARNCLAPVVRMRTRLASDAGLSGTVWLHLRCELN